MSHRQKQALMDINRDLVRTEACGTAVCTAHAPSVAVLVFVAVVSVTLDVSVVVVQRVTIMQLQDRLRAATLVRSSSRSHSYHHHHHMRACSHADCRHVILPVRVSVRWPPLSTGDGLS